MCVGGGGISSGPTQTRAEQPQKVAIGLNISDLGSRGIVHVLSVAKKGADQLRGYRALDLLFA